MGFQYTTLSFSYSLILGLLLLFHFWGGCAFVLCFWCGWIACQIRTAGSRQGTVISIHARLYKFETKLTLPRWQEKMMTCRIALQQSSTLPGLGASEFELYIVSLLILLWMLFCWGWDEFGKELEEGWLLISLCFWIASMCRRKNLRLQTLNARFACLFQTLLLLVCALTHNLLLLWTWVYGVEVWPT